MTSRRNNAHNDCSCSSSCLIFSPWNIADASLFTMVLYHNRGQYLGFEEAGFFGFRLSAVALVFRTGPIHPNSVAEHVMVPNCLRG